MKTTKQKPQLAPVTMVNGKPTRYFGKALKAVEKIVNGKLVKKVEVWNNYRQWNGRKWKEILTPNHLTN